MLELKNITKNYKVGDSTTPVLKGISFTLRNSEFVSILGPSGCGKTTMLNIIGGLDQYSSGDLIINGKSTKKYNDRDWDTYRNHTIGFVFQSYNLIPHQTILKNVELALSISGISRKEKRKLAIEALEKVGLKDHIRKKPNQLSGGQCQRVSIARALVTNPDIILADEPTGALDTETSIQVMDILKEISKEKLVLMVTHNPDLANKYSTRIVTMLDGVITSDTNPVLKEEHNELLEQVKEKYENLTPSEKKKKERKSSMSLFSSIRLSLSNLLTKKKRTFITAFACSIGIIGISVILSVSNGMQAYITSVQRDSAATNFISIRNQSMTLELEKEQEAVLIEYPENTTGVIPYVPASSMIKMKEQILGDDFVNYLEENLKSENEDENLVLGISYARDTKLNVLTKKDNSYFVVEMDNWSEILDNQEYLSTQYDILAGNEIPSEFNEVVLVVDKYNRVSTTILDSLGISYNDNLDEIKYEELLNKEFKLVLNDDFYVESQKGDYLLYNNIITDSAKMKDAYENKGITLKITSILREKESAASTWISTGIGYTQALTEYVIDANKNSNVVNYQVNHQEYDVLTGEFFAMEMANYDGNLKLLGAVSTPSTISIYPKDFDSKEKITTILDNWNNTEIYKIYGNVKDEKGNYVADKYKVNYIDVSELVSSMLGSLINIITKTLIAFSVISLLVSSIMIAVITYASVIERIKEIGIIRSLGGRKKDISRVFISEACIIGAVSAVIALITTLGINGIINLILGAAVGVSTIAKLSLKTAIGMALLAIMLNLVASLIPSRIAAKKDPVIALRTE